MRHSDEYKRFAALVDRVLAIPHSVIKERVEEHRRQAALNPSKPGPRNKPLGLAGFRYFLPLRGELVPSQAAKLAR